MRPARRSSPRLLLRGFTLLEVVIVLTIMIVMLAFAIQGLSLFRAIEQSKLDVAASNLRAIWGAQRFYYLEYGRYGTLDQLAPDPDDPSAADSEHHADLIDPTIAAVPSKTFYTYEIELAADGLAQSFRATATHPATSSMRCVGSIAIDEGGAFDPRLFVTYDGTPMSPSQERDP
ncbi:type II secretion system protein [Paludisphaera mucosa]|uniref:Prepilin-type N-terminal cleavage/methylation domain-containing protein n=1 Tax=Paludisphaera mucosa TaxID=3030827 RepID=A0ABT6FJN0_9BACT|nr:prepilin-type N-terminal cleavage/methylation domain-containing protein [Paludisphaera mucosa]MDG3007706.1 prepilin-type N-terminal cleavage/methylation domain-containing protein [Paludisphaera mucosa]